MNHLAFRSQSSNQTLDRVMSPEQFTQVIEAILSGKYSWACVLILRFAGYNPLHYIPYRTYNRLIKDNAQCRKRNGSIEKNQFNQPVLDDQASPEVRSLSTSNQIRDLAYLETVPEKASELKGGSVGDWFASQIKASAHSNLLKR